jgi:hypothetical protein
MRGAPRLNAIVSKPEQSAGRGYREESIGHEVMIAHGTPAAGHRLTHRKCPWAPPRTERHVTSHSQKDFARFRKPESD